jgi:phosphoribosylaminoimidazole-succinocarboxamide synthase
MEFGRQGKTIYLGDELSMDSMRLWDTSTGESLDKDVYRFDKGDVMSVYHHVANRITGQKQERAEHEKIFDPVIRHIERKT